MIPMGVITAPPALWTPTRWSPHVWLDTTLSPITIPSGVLVSQWNDISGNNRHATQATTARQPNYSATDQWMSYPTTTRFFSTVDHSYVPTGNQAWVAAAVFRMPTVPTNNATLITVFRQGSPSNTQDVRLGVGRFGGNYNRFCFLFYGNDVIGTTVVTNNTDYILVWVYDPEVGRRMYVNGTLDFSDSYVTANLPASPAYAAIGVEPSDTNFRGNHYTRTFITKYGAPSDSDRQKLEGYLAHKWGLAANLPVGHPYRTIAPLA